MVLCGGYGFSRNSNVQLDFKDSINIVGDSEQVKANSATTNSNSNNNSNANANVSNNETLQAEQTVTSVSTNYCNTEIRDKVIKYTNNKPQLSINILKKSGFYIVTDPDNGENTDDYFIHLNKETFSNLKKVVQDTFLLSKLANDTSIVRRLSALCKEMFSDNGEFESPCENEANSVPVWLYIAMAVMFIALVAFIVTFIVIFVKDRKNRREEIIKEVSGSDRIKKFVADEAGKVAKNAQPAPQSRSYDGDIRELQSRVATLEDANNKKQVEETKSPIVQQKPQQQQNRKLYAQSIYNGMLMRVSNTPNDETVFELVLKGDSKATLTLYRQAYEKIKADTSFLEGCDKSVLGRDSIVIKNEGEAVKDENDNWSVTRKLNVTLR